MCVDVKYKDNEIVILRKKLAPDMKLVYILARNDDSKDKTQFLENQNTKDAYIRKIFGHAF